METFREVIEEKEKKENEIPGSAVARMLLEEKENEIPRSAVARILLEEKGGQRARIAEWK